MKLKFHKNPTFWLGALISLYILVFSWACLTKYALFLYNAFDLAYFSQVFWNFQHGQPFVQTLHPHLSLGDHAELAIPLLLPLYAVWSDPRSLLIMQTIALAVATWPIYRLAQIKLPRHPQTLAKWGPLGLAAAWLAGPLVQNINLFEFHVLPFAILPLLLALLAYERRQFGRFLALIGLALLVREDVALVVMMFGPLAWLERRSWKWRLGPFVLGAGWFVAAMSLIGHFAPAGNYKFAIYYDWLGATPLAMLQTIVTDPLRLLRHLLTVPNLEMTLGLLMAVGFLPLLAPRRLLLTLGPLAVILLGAAGGSQLILEMHYAAPLLLGLFAAAIDGLARLPAVSKLWERRFTGAALALPLLVVCSVTAAALAFGPLPGFNQLLKPNDVMLTEARAAAALVAAVPPNASVAASYRFLAHLTNRAELYANHYQFLGVTQFATGPYSLPADVDYLVWDPADALTYSASFPQTEWTAPQYADGFQRLREFLNSAAPTAFGQFQLFNRRMTTVSDDESLAPSAVENIGNYSLRRFSDAPSQLTLAVAATETPPVGLAVRVTLLNGQTVTLPPNDGLFRADEIPEQLTSTQCAALRLPWTNDEIKYIALIDQRGGTTLDRLRTMVRIVLSEAAIE